MKNCDDCGKPLPDYCARDIVCYPCATRYTSRGLPHPAWRNAAMKSKSEWTKMLPSVSTGIDGWNEIAFMINAIQVEAEDDARHAAIREAAEVAKERVAADCGATPEERKGRASDARADEAAYIERAIRSLLKRQ